MMALLPMLAGAAQQGQQQDQQRLASVGGPAQGQGQMSGGSALQALAQLGQNSQNQGATQPSATLPSQVVPNPSQPKAGQDQLGGFLMQLLQSGGH